MHKLLWLFVLIVFFLIAGLTFSGSKPKLTSDDATQVESKHTVDRYAFDDLTIPFLMSRTYGSNISTLTNYKDFGTYSSFLTSYDSDGLKINGLLAIPKGKTPEQGWPAVVFVHGYIPPTLYKTTEKYIEYIDYLAKNGVAVFKIDLRGHGNSEGEPSGAYYSSDYVIDTLNAYEAVKKFAGVDPNNISIWGHSMAGNVAFRAAVVQKNIPKIFLWAGAVYTYADFSKYGIKDNSYRPPDLSTERQKRRKLLFDTYGTFSENNDFWRKVVGTNFLDDVSSKFIIQHAVDDQVVGIGYSRDLDSELKKQGKNSVLYEYKSGGHNISGSSFNTAMGVVLEEIKR